MEQVNDFDIYKYSKDDLWLPNLVKGKIFSYFTFFEQHNLYKLFTDDMIYYVNDEYALKFDQYTDYNTQLTDLQRISQSELRGTQNRDLDDPYHNKDTDPDHESSQFGYNTEIIHLHEYKDWVNTGLLDPTEQIETMIISPTAGNASNGYMQTHFLDKWWEHSFILQIQIFGKTWDQLKTIIYNIDSLELEIGGLRHNYITKEFIRLQWNLFYESNHELKDKPPIFSIFKEFCNLNQPHALILHLFHQLRISIIWLNSNDLLPGIGDLSTISDIQRDSSVIQIQYQQRDDRILRSNHRKLFKFDNKSHLIERLTCQWQYSTSVLIDTDKINLRFNYCSSCLVFWFTDLTDDDKHYEDSQYLDILTSIKLNFSRGQNSYLFEYPAWILSQAVPESLGLPPLPTKNLKFYVISFNEMNPFRYLDFQIKNSNPVLNLSCIENVSLQFKFNSNVTKYKNLRFHCLCHSFNTICYGSDLVGIVYC